MLTSIIHIVDETRLDETGVDEMSIRRTGIRRTGTNLHELHGWGLGTRLGTGVIKYGGPLGAISV